MLESVALSMIGGALGLAYLLTPKKREADEVEATQKQEEITRALHEEAEKWRGKHRTMEVDRDRLRRELSEARAAHAQEVSALNVRNREIQAEYKKKWDDEKARFDHDRETMQQEVLDAKTELYAIKYGEVDPNVEERVALEEQIKTLTAKLKEATQERERQEAFIRDRAAQEQLEIYRAKQQEQMEAIMRERQWQLLSNYSFPRF